jgi:RimJ/RimL family protein N-acetyltransferase
MYDTYASDIDVVRYLTWTVHTSLHDAEVSLAAAMQSWREGSSSPWTIRRTTDGVVVGSLRGRNGRRGFEVGYVIGRAWWGNGYAAEALRAVVDWALDEPSISVLEATTHPDNVASARVLTKCGFASEGQLSEWLVYPNLGPEPVDCAIYTIRKPAHALASR